MAPLDKRVGTPSDPGKTELQGVGNGSPNGSSSQERVVPLAKSSGSSSPAVMAGQVDGNGSSGQGFEGVSLGHQGVTRAEGA
jgi:hypothetical protein